jgi:hypothetical protein
MTICQWIRFKRRKFSNKLCREKKHILCLVTFFFFFWKSWRVWNNVKKRGGHIEATNNKTIWRTSMACWISNIKCARAYVRMCTCTRLRARAPNTNTRAHILSLLTFFRKSCLLWDKAKHSVEPERPQMTSQYGAYALCAGWERLHVRKHMYTPKRPGTRTQALIYFPRQ